MPSLLRGSKGWEIQAGLKRKRGEREEEVGVAEGTECFGKRRECVRGNFAGKDVVVLAGEMAPRVENRSVDWAESAEKDQTGRGSEGKLREVGRSD